MKRFNQAMVVYNGCRGLHALAQALESASREPAAAQEKHWAYEDSAKTVGPAKWGALAGDATCSTGKQQAPINVRAGMATPQDLPNLVFAYKPSSLSITNNGHTEQMTFEAGSTLGRVGTQSSWTLAQFHFHDPSEHTVDGTSYPLEMHLVHLDAAGKPAVVVAVFIQAGKENVALAPAFQSLPAKEGDTVARPGETIDAAALLPADRTFFYLRGLADHTALHRRHHVVRDEGADRDVTRADRRVHEARASQAQQPADPESRWPRRADRFHA